MRPQVVDGFVERCRRSLQATGHEMPGRSVTGRYDREVIDAPHEPVTGHGERVARQEAGIPEGRDCGGPWGYTNLIEILNLGCERAAAWLLRHESGHCVNSDGRGAAALQWRPFWKILS